MILTVLTESDEVRMASIMQNVLNVRSQREVDVNMGKEDAPVRDETRIAEILRNAEARANEQHRLLLESRNSYSGYIGNGQAQTTVKASENLKKFPKVSDWKRRFPAS